ncbi:SulP family inorganic anion transporter [Variovorax saccharolyticus]|uniref:SulP family inorganic anion transporter n=1 Tax=Variovorax saccharolyticus TaxID=3053516 RepID=UPI002576A88C|nr:SulP family inorganic anion transporter [Variovorax sp. J22R187]MDM0018155.1 SulP family inorganic anion transporter [Variovorax sp. J22R187]
MQIRILASLRNYRVEWLSRDLVAGLMLAAIAIPGQLATARLAGMPPETGIYAFAAGSIAFAVFGANRFMSVGADSTIAPIFAGGLASIAVAGGHAHAQLAPLFALLVGALLIVIGLLRAGWLSTLLSVPVTTGFLAGIAVHIAVGELPTLLGVPDEKGHLLPRLVHVIGQLPQANPLALALGVGVLGVTLAASRLGPRIPGALIGLVGAGVVTASFHLETRGVSVLGPLAVTLPQLALPALPGIEEFGRMVQLALVVAMVCVMQTAAVANTFPADDGKTEDVSRDFGAVGAGSVMAALVGAFPVNASPPRTAIVRESGGQSQLAALAAVALVVGLAIVASGLTAYVPHAALSGILLYVAWRIFRIGEMREIYRRGGPEILLVAASAALVVALPIETGMLLAILMSFVHSLYTVARPYCVELARVSGSTVWWPPAPDAPFEHVPGVLVFAPSAPINFTNCERICAEMRSAIARQPVAVKVLVVEANGIIGIDYTGSQILRRAITDLQGAGIAVALARLAAGGAQEQARRTGLIDTIGRERVFMSVEEAVRELSPRVA